MSAVMGAVAAALAVLAAGRAAGVTRSATPRPAAEPSGSVAPVGTVGSGPRDHVESSPTRGRVRPVSAPPVRLVVPVVVLVLAVAVVLGPTVAVGGTVVVGLARVRAARAAVRRRRRAVEAAVPDLVDLFVIAAAAGHPVLPCLVMVADRAPEPLRPALVEACTATARGMPLADALRSLGAGLGVLGPALAGALATSAATGAPLSPALRDVALVARDRRRREAETEARRLPVTLLFPLVCCVLPAFVLLAVVPLLAASLAALEI